MSGIGALSNDKAPFIFVKIFLDISMRVEYDGESISTYIEKMMTYLIVMELSIIKNNKKEKNHGNH